MMVKKRVKDKKVKKARKSKRVFVPGNSTYEPGGTISGGVFHPPDETKPEPDEHS
jgi:hypothetical protein